ISSGSSGPRRRRSTRKISRRSPSSWPKPAKGIAAVQSVSLTRRRTHRSTHPGGRPVSDTYALPGQTPRWPPDALRLAAAAGLVTRLQRLRALFPTLLRVRRRGLVAFPFLERRFAREAAVVLDAIRLHRPGVDRLGDGAARLAVMRAVPEPALFRQRGDV